MTGPQHYQEAERLLNMLPSHGVNAETGLDRAETFAQAQVHATLALAAATAGSRYVGQYENYRHDEPVHDEGWQEVLR